jgi:SAM-dependent methyltransferase
MEYNSLVARRFIMTADSSFEYDQVLYNSRALPQTHPDHLATLAILFGLRPAPAESCRVLELGCGNGANLIPMALTLPGSRFAGIDLAGVPIAAARARAGSLRLGNVVFHELDIMDLGAGFGEFDYVIAHGLYSWVPPTVRDKLLAVCKANLAPNGVAYVSYNTYPGCHLRNMIREMLLYQTREIADPQLKIKHAFALINFLAASNPKSTALREEVQAVRSRDPSVVFHDDLGGVNDPVYFHQFMEHAQGHGLQFLAEAEYFSMQLGGFPGEVVDTIRLLARGDRIREQQYLDFLKCRRFRQTLLCHHGLRLEDPSGAHRVTRLCVASPARPVRDNPDVRSDAEEEFRSDDGASMTTNLPLAKAAMLHLTNCWPLAVPFGELLREARALLGVDSAPSAEDAAALADLLMKIFTSGLVELHASPSRFTLSLSERPRAFALARIEAQSGTQVTTLRHSTVRLEDDVVRRLVVLLDGSRDHPAVLRDLQDLAEPDQHPNPLLPADLERNLREMARLALLEG